MGVDDRVVGLAKHINRLIRAEYFVERRRADAVKRHDFRSVAAYDHFQASITARLEDILQLARLGDRLH